MLAREAIFDAAVDDAAFAALPHAIAQSYGARSVTLHWSDHVLGREVFADNGYFDGDAVALLIRDFYDDDIWSDAVLRPGRRNCATISEDAVPEADYRASRIYNEWTRAIGDDTLHCLGMGLSARDGIGCIGLHRGPAAGMFDVERRTRMQRDGADIAAMLRLRARIGRDAGTTAAEAMLDHLDRPAFALAGDLRIVHANRAGWQAIEGTGPLAANGSRLQVANRSAQTALEAIVGQMTGAQSGSARTLKVAMPSGDMVLSINPLVFDGHRLVLLSLAEDGVARDGAERLRMLYELSPAEAAIAVALASGATPAEIAAARQSAIGTVRVQIKSIAWKMGCHRQAEIAVRVVRALTFR